MSRPIAIEAGSWSRGLVSEAVKKGGGVEVPLSEAEGMVFVGLPEKFEGLLDNAPNLKWIQLPWAGVEPYQKYLDSKYEWTCGKGVYAEPVAEMALTMILAGFRGLNQYVRAKSWQTPIGKNLLGARVLILGGGGICESLVNLLQPFQCEITVVRKHKKPLASGASVKIAETRDLEQLYPNADAVVLALALTPETQNIIDKRALDLMDEQAWLINVARGQHVCTDDLIEALKSGSIAGAVLDVTEPEPLPKGHALWKLKNCIITPHSANTAEMALRLLCPRVQENVRRFCAGEELLGPVSPELGY